MKSIICPKCFGRSSAQNGVFHCTKPTCPQQGTPQEISLTLPQLLLARSPVCSGCQQPLSRRSCPHCGYQLEHTRSHAKQLSLTLVGAPGSGKSNYLSVLVHQLKQEMAPAYGCALYPLGGDDTIHLYESQYYEPLFVRQQCVPSTQQQDILPLVYSLVFSDASGKTGQTCNITMYDSCGASFRSENQMADQTRSLTHSQGILLFVDASQLPPNQSKAGAKAAGPSPQTLLARLIHLLRSDPAYSNVQKKLQIPLAVCITKLDTVWDRLDPASFLRYSSRHLSEGSFDPMDFHSCSLETQSLLEGWLGKEYLNQITSQFASYGFFGLSALGSAPSKDNRVQRVSPHRVCDPLLWTLAQHDIIRTKAQ